MFCDGVCIKGKKRCGLYVGEVLQERMSGTVKTEDKCIFVAILTALVRAEHQRDGLHAAQNSTRNEAVKGNQEVVRTMATGFLGLLKGLRQVNSIEVQDGKRPKAIQLDGE